MLSYRNRIACSIVFVLATITAAVGAAGVDIKVEFDKTFNFAALKTYGWQPGGAGEVKLLEQLGEDPAVILQRFDPVLKPAIEAEMAKRGLVPVTTAKPDLYIHYYLLIGPNSESQFRGQFVGAVPPWGLPDYAMTTSALKIYEQGTVVLDLIDTAHIDIVWRGIARAEIQRQRTPQERDKRIRDVVVDLMKKFPTTVKK